MHTIRVLIAYNNFIFCEGISELLQKEDDLEIVGKIVDGTEILDHLHQKPDVFILDPSLFSLEELPGILHKIKEKSPKIKILLCLKEELPEQLLVNFLMFGVDGYIKRSINAKHLIAAIRAVYAGDIWAERSLLNKFVTCPTIFVTAMESKLASLDNPLTKREKEIVSLLLLGLSNRTIADRLHICEKTVKTHFNSIFKKMKVKNRSQLVAFLIH